MPSNGPNPSTNHLYSVVDERAVFLKSPRSGIWALVVPVPVTTCTSLPESRGTMFSM